MLATAVEHQCKVYFVTKMLFQILAFLAILMVANAVSSTIIISIILYDSVSRKMLFEKVDKMYEKRSHEKKTRKKRENRVQL